MDGEFSSTPHFFFEHMQQYCRLGTCFYSQTVFLNKVIITGTGFIPQNLIDNHCAGDVFGSTWCDTV